MSFKKIVLGSLIFSILLIIGIGVFWGVPALAQNPTYFSNVGTLRNVVTPGFSFTKDLRVGDTDPDVIELQKVLNADLDTIVAYDDVGSKGHETSYFGESTKTAVIKFQNKYKDIVLTLNGIQSANGLLDKPTRTRLNLLIGVINTYDSVGKPQGVFISNTQTPTSSVVISPAPMTTCKLIELLISIEAIPYNKIDQARRSFNCFAPQQVTSSCQLVELLINIEAIPLNKANQARLAIKCTDANSSSGVSNSSNVSNISSGVNNYISRIIGDDTSGSTNSISSNFNSNAFVDLKINNQDSTINLDNADTVNISWTSDGVYSCVLDGLNVQLSGAEDYYINRSNVFQISCTGTTGMFYDSIPVILGTDNLSGTSDDLSSADSVSSNTNSESSESVLGANNTTSISNNSTSTDAAFGGLITSIEPCLVRSHGDWRPISGKFELGISGFPFPGALVIWDPGTTKPPLNFFVLGTASGSGSCITSRTVSGFKKLGTVKTFGSGSGQ